MRSAKTTDQRRVPVEVRDPALSERANEIMTAEVRAAVGADEALLPPDRARRAGRDHPPARSVQAALWNRRILLGVTLAAALVVASVLVLSTGSWWWILLPLGVHAAGTLALAGAAIAATADVESPDPAALADLEAEGVRDAEHAFDAHVRSFSGGGEGGAAAIVTPGENQGRATADDAEAEVPRIALLWPAGAGAALLPGTVVIAAVGGGGLLWLIVPIVWPLALALVAFDVRAYRRAAPASERG